MFQSLLYFHRRILYNSSLEQYRVAQQITPKVEQRLTSLMETNTGICLCYIALLGLLVTPHPVASANIGGSDSAKFPTIAALLGPSVTDEPTVKIGSNHLRFTKAQLET
ncbi:hypothetical protein ElyMa_001964300 [Elysia marginata]|uniref:Uncharacterized protein n=1 Tax=Elysia marginata TaxID=1093978 RepID=A0AAV4F0K9_9GAST|nr:hypothetical protein ElyMa_001964300 [Elysia marginata]